jgi:hypothetical protein
LFLNKNNSEQITDKLRIGRYKERDKDDDDAAYDDDHHHHKQEGWKCHNTTLAQMFLESKIRPDKSPMNPPFKRLAISEWQLEVVKHHLFLPTIH